MLQINGKTFEFDMFDADTYEVYMAGAGEIDEIMAKTTNSTDTEEYVALLKEKCTAVRKFVESILGEGAGKELCPKDSLKNCMNVLMQITDNVYSQVEEFEEQTKIYRAKREKYKEVTDRIKTQNNDVNEA